MKHKTRCIRWARKYLRGMDKNIMTAFSMGYDDGAAGLDQQSPPFPETTCPGTLVYAVTLYAKEMYDKGYEAGTKVKHESS